MQRLEVSVAVGPIYGSLGIKRLIVVAIHCNNGYKYASECYVLRTWPVFLIAYKSELREFFVVFRQKMR